MPGHEPGRHEVKGMVKLGDGQFCTVAEAARLLEVSPSTIWRWIDAQRLPAYRLGPRSIRIRRQDLEAAIRPARGGGEAIVERDKPIVPHPSPGEIARRKALIAEILAKREERRITPMTTADLVRKARNWRT